MRGVAGWLIALIVVGGLLLAVALYDVIQRRHTILANFPIVGHFRYPADLARLSPEQSEVASGLCGRPADGREVPVAIP